MTLTRYVATLVAGGLASSMGCASPPVQATPHTIRVAVGSRGGDFWNYGVALEQVVRAHPGFTVALDSAVGLRTLQAVNEGTSDCGFGYANLAYEAFSGKLERQSSGRLDELRGVASIEITPLNLVVSKASGVKNVAELLGRRVVIGTPDSGSYRAARLVLEAHGLSSDEEMLEIIPRNFGAARQLLEKGQADAVFQLRRRPPLDSTSSGRLVPIEGPPVASLRRQYPFFRPVVIRMGSYPGQMEPIKTVGIESVFLCGEHLAPEVVRQLAADWFAAVDQLVNDGAGAETYSRQAAAATPIPLHQGARDFYRARQVLLRD
jgi:uncharacterized protein